MTRDEAREAIDLAKADLAPSEFLRGYYWRMVDEMKGTDLQDLSDELRDWLIVLATHPGDYLGYPPSFHYDVLKGGFVKDIPGEEVRQYAAGSIPDRSC